jgi:hypothetical protein
MLTEPIFLSLTPISMFPKLDGVLDSRSGSGVSATARSSHCQRPIALGAVSRKYLAWMKTC